MERAKSFESILLSQGYSIYSNSINTIMGKTVLMAFDDRKDIIISEEKFGFIGEKTLAGEKTFYKNELNHENANTLRKVFPFTAPITVLQNSSTMGVGDRLGIATMGHIQAFNKYINVFPVFAQQSMRELDLTGRSYLDVLDNVSFAVFKNGYKRGFGADGDHLKTAVEIESALSIGFSMITLDCSKYIQTNIDRMSDDEVNSVYISNPQIEAIYLDSSFDIGQDTFLSFEEMEFKRTVLIFNDAIDFIDSIYSKFFRKGKYKAELEISIDETEMPTSPIQHFFVANELHRRGIEFSSLAPHFCGEFEKGIDYIGNLDQFEREFKFHALIANHFNYKISIHSGSDKFSVYPIISRLTNGKLHIKTSGTSWLEAMRIVATVNPMLYRSIHRYALSVFEDARKNYRVSTNLENIPDIDSLSDVSLNNLFSNKDARQLIHITYGYILNAKDSFGVYQFKEKLFKIWKENESLYADQLEEHICRHMNQLWRG